jgi:hypothetical protein
MDREDAHANEDVLPASDPAAEDVLPGNGRPHLPISSIRTEDDFSDDTDGLEGFVQDGAWSQRLRAGVQLVGRLARELGGFLADWDAWELARMAQQAPETRSLALRDTVLPLQARRLRLWTPGRGVEETIEDRPIVELGPGESCELYGRPQLTFKPEKISWLSDPDGFDVLDFKIGRNSQFAASGAIPASAFAGVGNHMVNDTAQISMDVMVVVQNVSDKPLPAPRVAVFGKYSE